MSRLIGIALAGTMLIVIWSAANISWSGLHASGIIKADGRGYYAHLPALFIYHDLNFGHFDSIEAGKYNNPNYNYDYRKYSEGYTLNKYFAGTSLAMLPFFGLGHALTLITGEDADGYSNYYQIAISLAGITYLFLSLLVLIRIAREFHISDKAIALAIPIIVLGTNWYYYVVSEPAMSHVYSVFFISTFVYQSIRWSRGEKTALIWMGILLGLITFIRPVNAIIVFIIPVLFKNISDFSAHLLNAFKHPGQLMAAIGLAVLIPMLQLVVYKIQTGHFFIYAYEEEGFDFLHPHFLDILLSYKKGLFLYTPLTLIGLVGVYVLFRRSRFQGIGWLMFFGFITYILSSWWNWYYGGSFSSRAYLEYLFIFFIPLGLLIDKGIQLSGIKRLLAISTLVVFTALCQFQTYQYRRMVIHWDQMNKTWYWDVFLSTDFTPRNPDDYRITPK